MDNEHAGECRRIEVPHAEIVCFESAAPYKQPGEPGEDRIGVIEIDARRRVLVVADGVGGLPQGEVASAMVLDRLNGHVKPNMPVEEVIPAVVSALESAHGELVQRGSGAASTAAIAVIDGDSYRPVHVGDSVVLVCSNRSRVKFETIAHSPVGYALEAGVIDEEQAFTHPERHVVSSLIGGDSLHIALGGVTPLARRDTLLLASDGLTDNLRREEVVATIRAGGLRQAGEQLAARARARMNEGGKPDDLSFILYRRRS